MKISKIILPIGAVILLYLALAVKAVTNLNYFIKSVALSFSGITPILNVVIGIQNVTNESFQIDSFVGNLSVNGSVIGTISSYTQMQVAPVNETDYPIVIQLSLVSAVSDLINLLQGNSGPSQTIVISGNISASGVVAPVNLSYPIGV